MRDINRAGKTPKPARKVNAADWDSDRIKDIFEQYWSRHTQQGVNPQILTVYDHEGECLSLRLCRKCNDPLVFHSTLEALGHIICDCPYTITPIQVFIMNEALAEQPGYYEL